MNKRMTRRDFLTYTSYGIIASTTSFALLPKKGGAAEKISLNDPIAKALGYVEVTPIPAQICDNCLHAKGTPGAAWRPCALFQNKLVAKNAWCKGWVAI